MRIKYLKFGLISVLLAFAIMFSIVFILPVFAGGVTSTPGGTTINVVSGQTFLLRHELFFNQASFGGYFAMSINWDVPSSDENFTLENTPSVYWISGPESGLPVENVITSQGATLTGWQITAKILSSDKNYIDGHFNVDIWLRARGGDGTSHSTGSQELNYGTGILVVEQFPNLVAIDPVTIQVLGLGVDVTISPDNQSGVPGTTLNYTVTVKNTGGLIDNYNLTFGDNAGWGANIQLDNHRFENVQLNENRVTTLHVHIPGNATGGTADNIWVQATSQGDNTKSDNESCIARVTIARGVQVIIEPHSQENDNGGMLTYKITAKNNGNVQENFQLTNGDNGGWILNLDNGWLLVPNGENRTTDLTVTIPANATGGTVDNIWVQATSSDNSAVFDNKSCLANVKVVRGVDVSISPSYQSGLPGENLNYTVTVTNTGNAVDTYNLVTSDNASWSRSVLPSSLTVPSLENRTATLRVTVPLSAIGDTSDNVIVKATSTENAAVSDNASAIAHATIVLGVKVSISPQENSARPGRNTTFKVTVTNTGDITDTYDLTLSDNSGWGPTLDNSALTLAGGAKGFATITVLIPDNATTGMNDNIIIRATSRTDNTILADNWCVAHSAELLTEISTVIYPAADVYAFGESGIGYSRSQLKFDISGIPSQGKILSAKLWLRRLAADGWDGGVTVGRVNDQLWSENITAGQFDAQILTNGEDYSGKFTSRGWDYLDVGDQLKVDYGAGNPNASFRLRWANDNGSEPSIGIDDGRFLVIDSENDMLSVIFASSEYGGSSPYLEIVYVPPYAVSASISPHVQSGQPTDVLSYTVTVRNTGNLDDNYLLTVSDNSGWGPTVSPTSLFVASGSTSDATLTVTIPENAAPGTADNVIVTATSTGNPAISASDSCIAQRAKIELEFATLYSVSLDLDIYLENGSKLVLKFYRYGIYQGENTIWEDTTPAHAVLFENVTHPLGLPVHEVRLVLTTDNTAEEISTLATLTVRQDDLGNRVNWIVLNWFLGSPSQQNAWGQEINDIVLNWFLYPV